MKKKEKIYLGFIPFGYELFSSKPYNNKTATDGTHSLSFVCAMVLLPGKVTDCKAKPKNKYFLITIIDIFQMVCGQAF